MKTLPRYLLRQVTASLALTVSVFTLVLLLGSVLRDILPLLISQKATFGILLQALGLLIPFVAPFALPIGMLTATLLVFGRFSADQELTAARASGVSLLSLVGPVVILSIALCGVSAAFNLEIAPRCRVLFLSLKSNIQAALVNAVQLPEGRVITDIPGIIFYTAKNHNQELQDVRIYQLGTNDASIVATIHAPRGLIARDAQTQDLVVHLYHAQVVYLSSGTPLSFGDLKIPLTPPSSKGSSEPKISDMTFRQLRNKLRDLESRINPPLSAANRSPEQLQAVRNGLRKGMDILELYRVEMHRRWAFSFACFGFTLVGIPLGIRVHRRETNIGFAVALGLLAVYYALIIIGNSLSGHSELAPHLLMWVPNFLFQAVGAVLLWRANRGI